MRGSNNSLGKKAHGFCVSTAAALTLFGVVPSTLASATPTRHAHVAASSSTKSSKSRPSKSTKSSASYSPARSAPRSSSHYVAPSKPVSHSRYHQPEQEIDTQSTYSAHSTPRSRAAEQRHIAEMLAVARGTRPPAAVPAPTSAPLLLASTQGQISAQAPLAIKKTLTTEDFMRAAGETPANEAIVTPAPANSSAPQAQTQSQRVSGFGAEGAVLNASRRNVAPPPLPPPSQVDPSDPELASLTHQSHEELAESALQPRLPNLYASNGRLIVPAPLVGSHDVLVHQNEMADAEGLSRIENDDQLATLRSKHLLVDYPESASLQLNPDLPENRRCGRPWSVKFAVDMARAYFAHFHQPLQINSAARTVQYQRRLERVNGNAAGTDGEGASPHLTGQAIDFGKRGMSITEISWMRAYLKPLMDTGKIDVEEEFHQACFHISVYRSYVSGGRSTPRELAQLGNTGDK